MRVRLDHRAPALVLAAAALVGLTMAGGGYSDLAIGVGSAAVWTLLLAAVLAGRLGGEEPPALLAAAAFLFALLALTALSLGWTRDDGSGFVEVVRVAGYLGVFLLAGMTSRRLGRGLPIAAVAIAAVAIAGVALGSRLLGIGSGDATLAALLPSASGRLSYPIGYWNALGALMALALPALVWAASTAARRPVRLLALAGISAPILVAYMASSRGALLAAAIGLAVVAGYAADRRRAVGVVAVGVASSLPAVVVATLASGILESPGDGTPGGSELAVLAALLGGMLFAALAGEWLASRVAESRLLDLRVPLPAAIGGVLAIAAVLIALAGPSALIGDLRSGAEGAETQRTVGIVSASGSGRAQFWETAVDAFTTEPVRGIGAGGYAAYWNQHGSLRTPAKNAHSEPLELLAELGLTGLACFLGFVVVVLAAGLRQARRRGVDGAAAALGIVIAGLVGFAIDWTWQVPAVAVPVLIAAGSIVGTARPAARAASARLPAAVPALATVAVAVAAIWAAGVLAVSASRLDASEEALAAGHLDRAAAAARSAAAIEPWAAQPWLQLAEIEQAGSNFTAAARAAGAAIRRSPDEIQPWLLATVLEARLGNRDAGAAYAVRATELAPSSD